MAHPGVQRGTTPSSVSHPPAAATEAAGVASSEEIRPGKRMQPMVSVIPFFVSRLQ